MNKIILDLCGGTGSWSRPYKDEGYDVRVVTLPEFDVRTYEPPLGVYGVLAAPPCTEFSCAKGALPRDFETGMSVVEACLKVVWKCQMQGRLAFWALENPTGLLRRFLGNPPYRFRQWWFGDGKQKPTDLWGYFNPPKRTIFEEPEGMVRLYGKRSQGRDWGNPHAPEEFKHMKLNRSAIRAITPPGFARAFYERNK